MSQYLRKHLSPSLRVKQDGIPPLPSCVYVVALMTAIYSKSHGRRMSFSPYLSLYSLLYLTCKKRKYSFHSFSDYSHLSKLSIIHMECQLVVVTEGLLQHTVFHRINRYTVFEWRKSTKIVSRFNCHKLPLINIYRGKFKFWIDIFFSFILYALVGFWITVSDNVYIS